MRRKRPDPKIAVIDTEILTEVRKNFWSRMNLSERGLWSALWGQTKTHGGMSYKGRTKLYNMMLEFAKKESHN